MTTDIKLADLPAFQELGYDCGAVSVAIWLARPDACDKEDKIDAYLSRAGLKAEKRPVKAMTLTQLRNAYENIGTFYLNNAEYSESSSPIVPFDDLLNRATSWAMHWPVYESPPKSVTDFILSKQATVGDRDLAIDVGDMLELDGEFWMILGVGHGQVSIIEAVKPDNEL